MITSPRAWRRLHHALRPRPVLDDACAQPFLDQAQDPLVRDAVLEELHQPAVVDGVIEPTDVGVQVAVGTALAGGPPHRSQRAGLPHWAPASGPGGEAE